MHSQRLSRATSHGAARSTMSCRHEAVTHESTDHVGQVHPITVRVRSPDPPHTGDFVWNAEAGEFRCD